MAMDCVNEMEGFARNLNRMCVEISVSMEHLNRALKGMAEGLSRLDLYIPWYARFRFNWMRKIAWAIECDLTDENMPFWPSV